MLVELPDAFRNGPNNTNSKFLPNLADIQAILPTKELVIFTRFHNDWMKIVDFYY